MPTRLRSGRPTELLLLQAQAAPSDAEKSFTTRNEIAVTVFLVSAILSDPPPLCSGPSCSVSAHTPLYTVMVYCGAALQKDQRHNSSQKRDDLGATRYHLEQLLMLVP